MDRFCIFLDLACFCAACRCSRLSLHGWLSGQESLKMEMMSPSRTMRRRACSPSTATPLYLQMWNGDVKGRMQGSQASADFGTCRVSGNQSSTDIEGYLCKRFRFLFCGAAHWVCGCASWTLSLTLVGLSEHLHVENETWGPE